MRKIQALPNNFHNPTILTRQSTFPFHAEPRQNEAKAAFDRALLAKIAGEGAQVQKQLDQCQTALDRANRLVREAAEQMIPYAHIPTEKHILYLFNDAMPSHESTRKYLAEVIAFCKGQSQ
ncbi:hypothetical protein KJ782_06850 [Patescibacteria group bacterium]|nr:hypothetical protein [Patescibacteria group bacterium]